MSAYDANVQTILMENAMSCINRDELDRQLLHVALDSRIYPTDPVTHRTVCLMNI